MDESFQHGLSPEQCVELDLLLTWLDRSPRLARLLRYLGEHSFAGSPQGLDEYTIATTLFGRSLNTFDSGEDAIVRVEAHRLRKKLKQYYETTGRDHAQQLILPAGSYQLVFVSREPSSEASQSAEVLPETHIIASAADVRAPRRIKPQYIYSFFLCFLLIALASLIYERHLQAPGLPVAAPSAPMLQANGVSAPLPLRILCGYKGLPQTDHNGQSWLSDRYVSGGGIWNRQPGPLLGTTDTMLYDRWRSGDFFYNIPLAPGSYELHLYFFSPSSSEDAMTTFSVHINDDAALLAFDPNSDAMGDNVADERVFRDVSPKADGVLHLSFTGESGVPMLNALALIPTTPHHQLPIRITMQNSAVTDHAGNFWRADTYYQNGHHSTQSHPISGTPDPDVYSHERYGHFSYTIPVDARGRYTVRLHFAEFYFGQKTSALGGPGSRLFRVLCNGQTLIDNFDIFKEAGSLHLLTRTYAHIRPTPQGKINLTFEPIVNNASISAIEVLDEDE